MTERLNLDTPEDEAAALVVRIVEAIVDDSRAVELDLEPLTRRINFHLKVHLNDWGKLIGKRGAHSKALGLVLKKFCHTGEQWRLVIQNPEDVDRADRPPALEPESYDARAAQELLDETLRMILGHSQAVNREEEPKNTFTFTILPARVQDYEALVEQTEILPDRGPGKPAESLTLVAALGTLWRAYGARDGVTFKVVIPGR